MRYSVKIGEIYLRSEKPITAEDRKAAIAQLPHTLLSGSRHAQDGTFQEAVVVKDPA